MDNQILTFFVSRTNNKCQQYISWKRDPDYIAIDAFTIFWGNKFFLRISSPWPSQNWHPLDQNIKSDEIRLGPSNDLCFPFSRRHAEMESGFQDPYPGGRKIVWEAFQLQGVRL